MNILCLLFDDLTVLDAIGPYQVMSLFPQAKVTFVAERAGSVRSDDGFLSLVPSATLDEVSACDLLLVPGGFGARRLQRSERVLAWLREVDRHSQLTASVCTGSILLAAAGLLAGRRATTHWAFFDALRAQGAEPVRERIVRDGKYATAAGVSAGIDLGLALALALYGREVAERIQLAIEYDPSPPLAAGRPEQVSEALRADLYARMHARDVATAQP